MKISVENLDSMLVNVPTELIVTPQAANAIRIFIILEVSHVLVLLAFKE
jgi:hypothetical protein